jgi:hypothetical protein
MFKVLNLKMLLALPIIWSTVSFSQTFFHPNKFGLGYNFNNSSNHLINNNNHLVYISSGKIDGYMFYSNARYSNIPEESFGLGVNIYRISENKRWYPSLSLLLIEIDEEIGVGVGTSFPFEIYNQKNLLLIPEIGGSIALIKANDYDILSGGKGSVHAGLNIGYYLGRNIIITGMPGLVLTSPNSYFSISIGLIFTPDKVDKSDH